MVYKGEAGKRGMDWGFGISRCKLVYIGWINKVLLYSTGNYMQYPLINCNRKGRKKKEEGEVESPYGLVHHIIQGRLLSPLPSPARIICWFYPELLSVSLNADYSPQF